MGKFLNGVFVGIGIGLFIAPQTGQETRRMLMERVAAWRKSTLSEGDQHVSIKAYPSQMTTFPVPPVPPVTASTSEPQEQVATNTLPAQTDTVSVREPQEQIIPDVSTTDTPSTTSNQSATSDYRHSADTTQTSDSTTHSRLVLGADPDQRTSTETTGTDTENTDKLPTLSNPTNMPIRSAKRKASTRTSSTSKAKGHSRS
jgi:hypothetical protein